MEAVIFTKNVGIQQFFIIPTVLLDIFPVKNTKHPGKETPFYRFENKKTRGNRLLLRDGACGLTRLKMRFFCRLRKIFSL